MAVILQNPDVVGIGNAIVDVLSRAEDAFRPQTQVSGVSRQEVSGTVYLSRSFGDSIPISPTHLAPQRPGSHPDREGGKPRGQAYCPQNYPKPRHGGGLPEGPA